jgi:hypothetical protein
LFPCGTGVVEGFAKALSFKLSLSIIPVAAADDEDDNEENEDEKDDFGLAGLDGFAVY